MSSALQIRKPNTNTNTNTGSALQLAPEFKPSTSSSTSSTNKLCRNVLIYGQCRFEATGCIYSHDTNAAQPPSPTPQSSTPLSVASAANAAVFVPSTPAPAPAPSPAPPTPMGTLGGPATLEFVPRRVETPALSEDMPFFSPPTPAGVKQPQQLHHQAQMTPHQDYLQHHHQQQQEDMHEYFAHAMDLNATDGVVPGEWMPPVPSGMEGPAELYDYHHQQQHSQQGNGNEYYSQHPHPHPHQMGMGMGVGVGQHGHGHGHAMAGFGTRHPLQYHLYHPPSLSHLPSTHNSFFLPASLHQHLTTKSEATHMAPSVDMKLPEEVGGYVGLLPLDKKTTTATTTTETVGENWLGYKTSVYKAWKVAPGLGVNAGLNGDGRAYVLRRVEGFRLQHESAITSVEKWTRIRHPSIVQIREAFTTRAFGDHSLVFVYDFHPLSQTLYEAHLSPNATSPPNPWSTSHSLISGAGGSFGSLGITGQGQGGSQRNSPTPFRRGQQQQQAAGAGLAAAASSVGGGGGGGIGITERVLWSYIVQLSSAIRVIHSSGLAVRNLDPTKILVTGRHRVRLGAVGSLEVLVWDGQGNVAGYQQDDLLSLGKLFITLCCGTMSAMHNLPKSVDHISRVYSPDVKNVILYLLSKPNPRKSIDEVVGLLGGRVLDEFNSSLGAEDVLESELMRELENGRLVRLLTKFGFINERPEFDHDPRWAETGDRYLIKLFRDFVFHQVDENGRPVTDLSHVITCLNKLDAGVDEKIMLISRDEQSCLIVSYREVKNCIESAYLDLTR
ncbi:hypothetical protein T439DRAFT_328503 [Meredithblackwellia eburnea MCA 4105]